MGKFLFLLSISKNLHSIQKREYFFLGCIYLRESRKGIFINMEEKYGIYIIIGMCLLILLIGLMKKKAELVLNFFVRMVIGLVCVYFFNNFLELQGIPVRAGINPVNALVLGTLGTGGLALLYGISFYCYL